MMQSNFFYKFFKNRRNSNQKIVKYNFNKKFDLEEEMNIQILEINQKISENSKALVEAQIVKFRSTLSKSNNFIDKLGQNIYKVKLDDSINWHQQKLKELYFTRKKLKIKLEKYKGIFWLNRIKRFLKIFCLAIFLSLILFIFLSGFMIIIYLLPIILLVFSGYLLSKKKY